MLVGIKHGARLVSVSGSRKYPRQGKVLPFRFQRCPAMSAIPAIPAMSTASPFPGHPRLAWVSVTSSQAIPDWRRVERSSLDWRRLQTFGVGSSGYLPVANCYLLVFKDRSTHHFFALERISHFTFLFALMSSKIDFFVTSLRQ